MFGTKSQPWEHKVFYIHVEDTEDITSIEVLNRWGEEGWELISFGELRSIADFSGGGMGSRFYEAAEGVVFPISV